MFSINLYPEYDAHHALFRALCIRERFQRLPVPLYRIIDYYFLNPFDLHSIRMPGGKHKKLSKEFEHLRPYKRAVEPASLAIHMWQFQQAALHILARRSFVSTAALSNEVVNFSDEAVPSEFQRELAVELKTKGDVLDFLGEFVSRYPLSGPDGLKDRSGLLDYRYDVKSNATAA